MTLLTSKMFTFLTLKVETFSVEHMWKNKFTKESKDKVQKETHF